jgi:hypothetical protein
MEFGKQMRKSVDFSEPPARIAEVEGNYKSMQHNKQLAKLQGFEPLRSAESVTGKLQIPQISIRGDNNLINFGAKGVVRVNSGGGPDPGARLHRSSQWPQQILEAIRVKAAKSRRSNDEVCDLAGRVLGRAVLRLDTLTARELARVYEAVCAAPAKV